MAIVRAIDTTEKLIPVEIKLVGNRLDFGEGHICIKQSWRRPDGELISDHDRSYELPTELADQTQYAGLTSMQVLEFFAAYFEAKEQAARLADAAAAEAEAARIAAEAARIAAEGDVPPV